ncbi:endonuclease/exonuclease/phosphatase family protein [Tropicibacter naphthalenivorans]|uniref:endonuclease/exonuclease/phosphatase family protein n=1 Tax=Tropicibacter naphthalenivorans TaxID=441103 RepID=UPI00071C25D8|nr:endonuclease/exonuclease/phosphatase family protein [Tropicibacter naphthalenivorans]
MRIATYNVEWFDSLFDNKGRLHMDRRWSSRHDVTRAEQAEALGIVFTAMNADAVMVIEAPDTSSRRSSVRALTHFAESFDLRTREVVTGFANDTQQEIALMYDPAVLTVRHDPLASDAAPRFDGQFEIDLDVDATLDRVVFSKPPLELSVTTNAGQELRMIGAHLKSKAPHGARTRDEIMQFAIANRRKQLAQAIWLRRRIDSHLTAEQSLIVLGDLNDGPGLDEYEDLFGRSSVEIILGDGGPHLYDPHAELALQSLLGAQPTTARFFLKDKGHYLEALLDYIMVSPDLRARAPQWRIWHPFNDPRCYAVPELREALLTASDHFPVTLDIDL